MLDNINNQFHKFQSSKLKAHLFYHKRLIDIHFCFANDFRVSTFDIKVLISF